MGLPSGYKRLAYLLGSNSAYSIISGLHLTDADEVRTEVYITGNCNVYGCYTGSSAGDNFSLYVGSTYYARMGGKVVSNVTSTKNARLALVHNKEGMWINGTKRITFTDIGEFTASTDFYVGWLDNASSAKVIGRIYRLEVVGKFVGIPAMRVSDGVCGIYDTLNGTFYESAGAPWAGVLADETERSLLARRRLMMYPYIPGLIILPPGYTRYDYIQGDDTAYIDSGLRYYTEMATEVDLKLPSDVVVGRDAPIVGAVYYPGSYMQFGGGIIFTRRFTVQYGGQSTIISAITAAYVGAKLKAVAQIKPSQQSLQIKQGDTIIVTGSATATMGGAYASAIRVAQNKNVRVYRAKIYRDYDMQTLDWDGIPCTDPNGVPGMYDLVSRTFFSNAAGSGTLSVGFD